MSRWGIRSWRWALAAWLAFAGAATVMIQWGVPFWVRVVVMALSVVGTKCGEKGVR